MRMNDQKLGNAFKLVNEAVEKGYFPGAEVSVGNGKGVLRCEYFGSRCLYPEVLPLDRETLFDMASLTKVVATNSLFMVFLEKGLVSVYDRVGDYLDYFKGDEKDEVTLFNLLTHTAGFAPFKPLYSICKDYEDAIKYICSLDLEYKPGTRVVYSDFSFILLGYILEKIGQARLDKLCSKYVFKPLGMDRTKFNPSGDNIAATEIDKKTGKPLIGVAHDENARFLDGISGHAGLFSCIDDMTRFASMLINNGQIDGKRFLSPTTVSRMVRNYTLGLDENRGLGWCVKGDKISSGGDIISPTAFGHTGFTGTSIWVDRENDVYVVLLTNRVHPTRENNKIIRFRRIFHNAVISSLE